MYKHRFDASPAPLFPEIEPCDFVNSHGKGQMHGGIDDPLVFSAPWRMTRHVDCVMVMRLEPRHTSPCTCSLLGGPHGSLLYLHGLHLV